MTIDVTGIAFTNKTSLEKAGLAFIPLPGHVTNVRALDDYLSVISRIRYLWTAQGLVVTANHAERARMAMRDAYAFVESVEKNQK